MQKEQTGLQETEFGQNMPQSQGRADCRDEFFKQALAIVQTYHIKRNSASRNLYGKINPHG